MREVRGKNCACVRQRGQINKKARTRRNRLWKSCGEKEGFLKLLTVVFGEKVQ